MKNTILILIAALAVNFSALAANIGVDTASSYGGSWSNGSDPANSPFSNWDMWTAGTDANNFAGHFIGAGGFGMYANSSLSTGRTAEAYAQRLFDGGALTEGQSFSIDIGVNYRNGFKGIDLFSGTYQTVWNFNVAGDTYSPGGVALPDSAAPYAPDSVFTILANQLTATTFQVAVSRGGSNLYTSGNLNGAINGFKLYVGQTDPGDPNNLNANNLQIVPEPSSSLLMGLGLAGLAALRRVRKTA